MKSIFQEIFSGYSFRSKVENQPTGDLHVIQMKDLVDGYSRIGKTTSKIDKTSVKDKYLLQSNDVLFLSKGAHNYACVYEGLFHIAVASSAFFVIRPKPELVNAKYLAWYINQERVQKYLADHKAGTYTLNVNRNVVENIPLEVPSLEKQMAIVRVTNLQKREQALVDLIQLKRQQIVSEQLMAMTEEYD